MDEEELENKIREAYGYTDYYKDKYQSFGEYFNDRFMEVSHEAAYESYRTATTQLESLVREIYNNQENN